jgi:hypothetical protein
LLGAVAVVMVLLVHLEVAVVALVVFCNLHHILLVAQHTQLLLALEALEVQTEQVLIL